jgi:hypothetical protein
MEVGQRVRTTRVLRQMVGPRTIINVPAGRLAKVIGMVGDGLFRIEFLDGSQLLVKEREITTQVAR